MILQPIRAATSPKMRKVGRWAGFVESQRPSALPSPFPRPTEGWQLEMRQLGAAIQTMIAAAETKNVEQPTH